jgi:hypothetical protein
MSNNLKLLLLHLDSYNKNSFIYKLHEDDIFSTSLFFEFILEIQKYKELDGQFKIELVRILLYYLASSQMEELHSVFFYSSNKSII